MVVGGVCTEQGWLFINFVQAYWKEPKICIFNLTQGLQWDWWQICYIVPFKYYYLRIIPGAILNWSEIIYCLGWEATPAIHFKNQKRKRKWMQEIPLLNPINAIFVT